MKIVLLVAAVTAVCAGGGALSAHAQPDAGRSAAGGRAPAEALRPTQVRVTRSYADRRGEDAAAADIATAVLTSDASDNVEFVVSVPNLPALTEDVLLFIPLDLDRKVATGDRDGVDVLFQIDRSGSKLQRWDGARFAAFDHPPVEASYAGGTLSATLPVGRLGSRVAFDFGIVAVRGTGAASHTDAAPDNGRWTFALRDAPASARSLTTTFVPTAPVAGRRFAVRGATLVLTDGTRRSAAVRCTASVTGKRLAAGTRCSWVIPARARRQLLVVTVTGSNGSIRLTRTFRLRIR